jgi:uncharacterized protein YndB with AHSA1/START domain
MTEPGADPIIVEGHYPVPPARVFRAWTDPDVVKKWFGTTPGGLESATVDLRPGGRWSFIEHASQDTIAGFEGEYVEVVTDELLVFTWSKFTSDRGTGKRQSTPVSRVEIRFVPAAGGTDMRLAHSKLDADSRIGFRVGWELGSANLASLLRTDVQTRQNRPTPASR